MPTKKPTGPGAAKKQDGKPKPPSKKSVSLTKAGKDPKGGLTAEGRKQFNEATGGHLKAGVKGKADTPEKMKRKGSFLTRHFTHPQGPVEKEGEPTRQALQAAAWGEPVPKSVADEKKLAAKGRKLLDQYHEAKDSPEAKEKPRVQARKAAAKTSVRTKT